MTLFLTNDDIAPLLDPAEVVNALDQAYRAHALGESVCAPRLDFQGPTNPRDETYQLGVAIGVGARYGAIRIKSDMVFRQVVNGLPRKEKYCVERGRYLGLILLFGAENGDLVAILQDGLIQRMRVGADSALGVRYMARKDAAVLGILGAGGMARTHLACIASVRQLREVRIYSPTRENRERFAAEARAGGTPAQAVDTPEAVFAGADMVAACTNAIGPVVHGKLLEPGQHVTAIGGTLDEAASGRIDRGLRFGLANGPTEIPDWHVEEECLSFLAGKTKAGAGGVRRWADIPPERHLSFADLLRDPARGRTSDAQITFSERGNIHGVQFAAVAGLIYEKACAAKAGTPFASGMFLESIRN
jgi:ornithine cyclodeaminase/alanine dehydrogenase-like protein (mu-crystallin family)